MNDSLLHKIHTTTAPQAIGPYSQAIRFGELVFISGQIPLDISSSTPPTGASLVPGGISEQTNLVFNHLKAICKASGGDLSRVVKLTLYLTSLDDFPQVNEIMGAFFQEPYPARATVQVSALPKGAMIEVDAIMAMS